MGSLASNPALSPFDTFVGRFSLVIELLFVMLSTFIVYTTMRYSLMDRIRRNFEFSSIIGTHLNNTIVQLRISAH